jgi:hypothetical protein
MIRLGVLNEEIKPLFESHKGDVCSAFFRKWVEEMWNKGEVPANPRIVIKKCDEEGKQTALDDMSFVFQVVFRPDGLNDLPPADSLPEGMTLEDVLVQALVDEVKLSEENAILMVKDRPPADPGKEQQELGGEIVVSYPIVMTDSFQKLATSKDKVVKSAINKLIRYLNYRSSSDEVRLPQITEEEKNAILMKKQEVRIREGFFERAASYCRSVDELHRLLIFCKTTLKATSLKFGISDNREEKIVRFNDVVNTIVGVALQKD